VVTAKDEELSIGRVLEGILKTISRIAGLESYELLLFDGYSEDNTVEVAEKIGIDIFKIHGGKGDSIREAVKMARGEYILFMDADGSHMPEDIPRLLKAIKDQAADLVILSRFLGESEELGLGSGDSLLRWLGNKLSSLIVSLRWGVNLTDIQNGYRIIKKDVALELNLQERGFAIEQEIVMRCLKEKKKVIEIPGIEKRRMYGLSKICKRREFWYFLRSLLINL